MALAAASFGLAPAPLVTPAIMPYNLGSAGSQNSPWGQNNLPAGSQNSPWGLNNLPNHLQNYQSPYSTQNYLPSSQYNPAFYGTAMQFGNGFNTKANGQGNNNQQNGSGKKGDKKGSKGNGFFGSFFQGDKKKEENQDPYEKWREEMEEKWKEDLEEQEEEAKENKETFIEDFERVIILAVGFLFLDFPSAQYFFACEMFSVFLEKLGVNDAMNMIILLVVQCVDMVALFRGRFKLVDGYWYNWYQELYDTILTRMEIPDLVRLGTQYYMPQSPAPEYEEKR